MVCLPYFKCIFLVQDNGTELALTAQLLNCLINSETNDDKKKQIRRTTVDLGIFKYLKHIHMWKEADDFIQVALPYIQFQTSLLKRRKVCVMLRKIVTYYNLLFNYSLPNT